MAFWAEAGTESVLSESAVTAWAAVVEICVGRPRSTMVSPVKVIAWECAMEMG